MYLCGRVRVRACTCACMYVCVHAHVCVNGRFRAWMCACKGCLHTWICVRACMCAYDDACSHVCIRTYMNVHTHTQRACTFLTFTRRSRNRLPFEANACFRALADTRTHARTKNVHSFRNRWRDESNISKSRIPFHENQCVHARSHARMHEFF